jgi:hypothetical protein
MKRTIAIATLLFALCSASFAVIHFNLAAPQDGPEARTGVQDRPELKPLLDEFRAIIKARLFPLKLDDVAKTFGPKLATATNWWEYYGKRSGPELDQHPADLVLPIFASQGMMVSGLHTGNPISDKSHTDLHAIGDIGYVEFYYQLNGESVNNAAIYFRADDKFIPLKSTNDFSGRLEWDKGKLDALKNWLDTHLLSATDSKTSPPNATTAPTK